jgi:NADH-quinone oxidoreductase subunit K
MLNGVNVSLVAFDVFWSEALRAGQSLAIFVITIAAAEIGLGLAILLLLYRMRGSIAVDEATELREDPA